MFPFVVTCLIKLAYKYNNSLSFHNHFTLLKKKEMRFRVVRERYRFIGLKISRAWALTFGAAGMCKQMNEVINLVKRGNVIYK